MTLFKSAFGPASNRNTTFLVSSPSLSLPLSLIKLSKISVMRSPNQNLNYLSRTETFANSLPEQSVVSPIRSPLLLSLLSSRNYYALKWGRIGYYLNLQRPRYRNRGRPITESRAAPFQGLVLVLVMNPAALF